MGIVVERALVEEITDRNLDNVEACTAITRKCLAGFHGRLRFFANFSSFKSGILEPALASLVQKSLDAPVPLSFDVTNGKNGFFNCLQIAETSLEADEFMLVTSADIDPLNDNLAEMACSALLRKDRTRGFSYPTRKRFDKPIHYRFHETSTSAPFSLIEGGTEEDLFLDPEVSARVPCVITNYPCLVMNPEPEILVALQSLYEKEIHTAGPVLGFTKARDNSAFVFVNSDNSYYLSTYEF